ncbi:hypothetical protein BK138_34130 [Paenibacillus rhizosphaerae]|uniref:Uncharacterized protein n=1 Tax=Paenibacillus rhizosphaerae TaxID=297318 RepID=A0A1R1DZJ7_9BACL|nr:hypothetical protein BK138_34130 [Paenibacillus rhizosphaerae]
MSRLENAATLESEDKLLENPSTPSEETGKGQDEKRKVLSQLADVMRTLPRGFSKCMGKDNWN